MFPPDCAHTHPLASPHSSMWSPEHPQQLDQEALSIHLSQGGRYFSPFRSISFLLSFILMHSPPGYEELRQKSLPTSCIFPRYISRSGW